VTVGPTEPDPVLGSDPRRRFLQLSGWLDLEWYRDRSPVEVPPGTDLITHFLTHGAPAGIAPNAHIAALHRIGASDETSSASEPPVVPPENDPQLALEVDLVEASGCFDTDFYARQVAAAGLEVRRPQLLRHFCRIGWREALRPSGRFDVWWYWANFLDAGSERINPLVHYLLMGRAAGFSALPDLYAPRPAGPTVLGPAPRRVCLFAGYDAEGIVDDYVVHYVSELSRFADVYYLCDAYLDPAELEKLRPWTRGAWAVRHGAYDFGSWSMLAGELVGWETIEQYDEMLLVNDSCYLLRPLDDVFARMAARDCDWWGLQATKFLAATAEAPSNARREPIPLEDVRERWLPTYDDDEIYDFHIGSYFLAYRRPVIHDDHFRRLLESVHRQRNKLAIILKYEVGLTRFLNGNGYRFDTFVDALYPSQPIFTEWYFDLLEQGFPLLKKFLLYRNTYDVPGLARWTERVREYVPDAPVEMFERNLLRTAPADELERSFSIERDEHGVVVVPARLTEDEFRRLDEGTPTHDDWWAFVVYGNGHLPDNSRAIFEQVRHDPSVTKVVLSRGKRLQFDGANVHVMALQSPEGLDHLVRCRYVFVQERPVLSLNKLRLSPALHDIVLVRDGLAIRRAGQAARFRQGKRRPRRRTVASALLTSSHLDQVAMLAMHTVADYPCCRRTGIPGLDFVLVDHDALPQDLREQEDRLRARLDGRRLLLFAPEVVLGSHPPYPFGPEELDWLRRWTAAHNTVLGLREHRHDGEHAYRRLLGDVAVHLSPSEFPHVQVLLRVADAVLTDFCGTGLDFLVTGRPVVSFIHDLEEMRSRLFYDPEQVLPGPVCHDFGELQKALEHVFDPPDARARQRYERSRRLFHDHLDPHSAARAVAAVRSLEPVPNDGVPT
jgi:hypothetical protein